MIEVDFLWIGEETQTGDAIACRFTHPSTREQIVFLIDGGFVETGARIVDHVRQYYGTSVVDLVVCTHPDEDHIGGLTTVLEQLEVRRLLIHRPSQHGFIGEDYKNDAIESLVQAATGRGTAIDDGVFSGHTYFDGALMIAGPTEEDYRAYLGQQRGFSSTVQEFGRMLAEQASKAKELLRGVLGYDPGETLTDDNGGTSPRNNSSIVCDLTVEEHRVLFTGDAGAPALSAAVEHLARNDRGVQPIDLFDVPHHGSRHNLTKELCDRILGLPGSGARRGSAYVSVGKKAEGHPRPEVANALKRRGYPVFETRGNCIRWSRNAPGREGWGPITPLEWFSELED